MQRSFLPLLLSLSLLISAGCGAVKAQPSEVHQQAATALIDDASLRKQLLAGAQLAHETGKTTAMATLRTQLKRRQHSQTTALPMPSSRQLRGPALAARSRRSVVAIGNLHKCGTCSRWHVGAASGFFISADGLLVTSYHVVDKPKSATLVILQADGQVLPVHEVVAADQANDLAVLRVLGGGFTPLPLADIPPAGREIMVMSHPGGRFYSATTGVVSRLFLGRRSGRQVQLLQVDASFAKGSSGGPIVDARGAVVGVVRATQTIVHDSGAPQMVVGHASPAAAIRALVVCKPSK